MKSNLLKMFSQVANFSQAVFQIIFIQNFLESYCHCFQITACQTTIVGVSLRQNQQVLFFLGKYRIIGTEQSSYIHQTVLFCTDGATVCQ